MVILPECFSKKQQMRHDGKSQLLKIFDLTRYLTSTLKKDALLLYFPEIVNSRATFTTSKTFNKLRMESLSFSTVCLLRYSRTDILW